MQRIETEGEITEDGQIIAPAPAGATPGRRRMIIMVETDEPLSEPRPPLDLIAWEWEGWPAGCRFSREDLYDDAAYAPHHNLARLSPFRIAPSSEP